MFLWNLYRSIGQLLILLDTLHTYWTHHTSIEQKRRPLDLPTSDKLNILNPINKTPRFT